MLPPTGPIRPIGPVRDRLFEEVECPRRRRRPAALNPAAWRAIPTRPIPSRFASGRGTRPRWCATSRSPRTGGVAPRRSSARRPEYTEHILAMPEGAAIPTKLTRGTRSRSVAGRQVGADAALFLSGKTVLLKKSGGTGTRWMGNRSPDPTSRIRRRVQKRGQGPDQSTVAGRTGQGRRAVAHQPRDPPGVRRRPSSVDFSKSMLSGKFTAATHSTASSGARLPSTSTSPSIRTFSGKVRRQDETRKVNATPSTS